MRKDPKQEFYIAAYAIFAAVVFIFGLIFCILGSAPAKQPNETLIRDRVGAKAISSHPSLPANKKDLSYSATRQDNTRTASSKEKSSTGGVVIILIAIATILAAAAIGLVFFLRSRLVEDNLSSPPQQKLSDASNQNAQAGVCYGSEMERDQVSVVFVGIRGFKAYSRMRDHRSLMEDFNEYLSIVTKTIEKYGGYVDKFIGDAVIAIFNTSPIKGNHMEQAVNAALAIQSAFQKKVSLGNQLLSRVGMGISSGVVLKGQVNNDSKKEHTFIGESFRTAYSLNILAGPGEIMISKEVYQALGRQLTVEPLPPREIFHRTQSWENFRILGKTVQ